MKSDSSSLKSAKERRAAPTATPRTPNAQQTSTQTIYRKLWAADRGAKDPTRWRRTKLPNVVPQLEARPFKQAAQETAVVSPVLPPPEEPLLSRLRNRRRFMASATDRPDGPLDPRAWRNYFLDEIVRRVLDHPDAVESWLAFKDWGAMSFEEVAARRVLDELWLKQLPSDSRLLF